VDAGFYKNYFKIEKEHWLMRARRMIVRDSLDKYLGKEQVGVHLLDFGCGSGFFVNELAHAGFDSHGVDISEEAVRFGELQGIKNLGVITSHKINYPDTIFDVVLSLDVLEHLEDPSWALAEIERVLKPGGIFVVMVPAYMFLWGVQDEVAHHYRRYTKGMLLKEVEKSTSLSVVRSSYFNTFLFPPIALLRIVSRLFKIKSRESDFDINNPMLDKIFFTIIDFERKLLKKICYPFGVSIIAVFKK
jgi:2-polyprenyl-3-methyl-5-hydroxy-6-metoxy-1,4-benzoquinol methylase